MNDINRNKKQKFFPILILLSFSALVQAQSIQDKIHELGEQGSSVGTVTPVFSQIVKFNYPKGFVPAFESVKDNVYTQEHVLKGETVDSWTQMLSLFGFKDFSKNPNITVNSLGGRFLAMTQQVCPKSYYGGKLTDLKIDTYDAAAWFFSCGNLRNRTGVNSESTLMIVVKGESDFYNIQWAERNVAQDSPMKFDENKWLTRFQTIMPIKICQKIPGENPPYPSCFGK